MLSPFPQSLHKKLEQAREKWLYRSLKTNYPTIDFSSNDYLGFSSQGILFNKLKSIEPSVHTGSTGSRLISGNSVLFEEVEETIADFHQAEAALIYNSGYDANSGLLSCIGQKGDLILSDELIHASLIDGIRLSFATHYKFKHNDIESLKELITRYKDTFTTIYIVVESVYSMDGDTAPLLELVSLCKAYNLYLIVDEAHAIGVFGEKGKGLCAELHIEQHCFARIYTYGKAMGCHGAAVAGSAELKNYLINFSRSFIYTTAMPEHSLLAIKAAYQLLNEAEELLKLKQNITYFNSKFNNTNSFIKSNSAIHCKVVKGNKAVQALEERLNEADIFIKAIKSPTVKENQERIRICLHAFNTNQQIDCLFELLN